MKLTRVFGRLVIAVLGATMLAVAAALMIYPPEYIYRILVWQGADAFDLRVTYKEFSNRSQWY